MRKTLRGDYGKAAQFRQKHIGYIDEYKRLRKQGLSPALAKQQAIQNSKWWGHSPPTLYWHGSKEGVENAMKNGLLHHGTGSESKFWATTRGKKGWWTRFSIGGNRNVDSLFPFKTSTKGGFEAVYKLTVEEAANFRRAWGIPLFMEPISVV